MTQTPRRDQKELDPASIDTGGLALLFATLRRPCNCEAGHPSLECRIGVLDRWWIALVTGRDVAA